MSGVNFLGVGKGGIWGEGADGQWLDQLVWQTHELCPELVSRLGVGLRGGQLSWGVHGVEKWLSSLVYGAAR